MPTEAVTPEKKSFLERIGEGIKNVGFGLAALPAHIVTNPLDVIGKALVVGISAIPGLGGIVTGAYVFKQSYRETGKIAASIGKAFVTGVIAAALPGSGAAITGAYATKNIGEQIQREVSAGGGSATSIIKGKYREAGKLIKELLTAPEETQKRLKKFDLLKAMQDTIDPLTPGGVQQDIERQATALNPPVKESQGGPVMVERTSEELEAKRQGQSRGGSLVAPPPSTPLTTPRTSISKGSGRGVV